jgi:hypothetical protein
MASIKRAAIRSLQSRHSTTLRQERLAEIQQSGIKKPFLSLVDRYVVSHPEKVMPHIGYNDRYKKIGEGVYSTVLQDTFQPDQVMKIYQGSAVARLMGKEFTRDKLREDHALLRKYLGGIIVPCDIEIGVNPHDQSEAVVIRQPFQSFKPLVLANHANSPDTIARHLDEVEEEYPGTLRGVSDMLELNSVMLQRESHTVDVAGDANIGIGYDTHGLVVVDAIPVGPYLKPGELDFVKTKLDVLETAVGLANTA